MGFCKVFQLIFKNEFSLVEITHLKFTLLTHDEIKNYYQQPTSCKIVLFLHEIISEDVGISKLVSQLKLLPSLFELKDNDPIVMSTIIKKLQDMSRNRSFLISEVGKTVSLLLVSQATNPESDGFFSALKRIITYLMSTTGSNRLHVRINVLDNINLADVVNHFVDRKDSRKQTFRHFSQSYS